MDKLLILDGNSLAYRAYYAMPYMTNKKGEPTGATYGFVNILLYLLNNKGIYNIVVAFDHSKTTFRNEIYSEYKGTRKPMPDDLRVQMPVIKAILKTIGIKTIEIEGIEADDIIGSIAKLNLAQNYIVSGDRDLWQLIDENTTVWATKKGVTDLAEINVQSLMQNYGITPSQVVDLKSLMGDSSDNIPGVKGIGEKTAKSLVETYGTLDNIYQHVDEIKGATNQKLVIGKSDAYMSYKLATIKTDCDIEIKLDDLKVNMPFSKEVYNILNDLDFTSITKRKELFESGVFEQTSSQKRTKITNVSKLKDLLDITNPNIVVCEFNKKLYIEFNEYYYEQETQLSMFSNTNESQYFFDVIKDVLLDENVLKITNNLKSQMHILVNNGINTFDNYFDISLAEYLTSGAEIMKNNYEPIEYLKKYQEQVLLINQLDMYDLYYKIELPLVSVLFNMEKDGFKIDDTALEDLLIHYSEKVSQLKEKIITIAGVDFNINSPKQLSEILYDKLGLVGKNKKDRSTGIEVLNNLKDKHEIIEYIIKYRKYQKLVSTYLEPYKTMCAMNGNILHTIFNQMGTNTGRLSSSEPNLQNIPIRDDEGKILRKLFVSRFENGSLVSADYSQVELRLVASLSGDNTMIDDFNNGVDIHTATASNIFDVPINEVSSAMRRTAKAVNFGIIYGISEYGLAENIDISNKEAKKYIEKYFEKYPTIKGYLDNQVKFAYENGYVKTYFNRRRVVHELSSSNYMVRQFGERVAKNMPLQGTASDIIKIAMIKINQFIKENNLKSKLILQIHDELIIDCTSDEVETVKQALKDVMENVVHLKVKLLADVNVGKNLLECK